MHNSRIKANLLAKICKYMAMFIVTCLSMSIFVTKADADVNPAISYDSQGYEVSSNYWVEREKQKEKRIKQEVTSTMQPQ